MRRTKVLQFVTGLHVGGTERHVIGLSLGLDPERYEVHVACLHQTDGRLVREIEGILPLKRYPIARLYGPGTWGRQRALLADLRAERYDIVHAYGMYPIVFAVPVARLAGTRVVLASIRDNGDVWTPSKRRAQKWACRAAHAVLTNAAEVRRRLAEDGYHAASIAVIRNGVDLERFAPRPHDPAFRVALGAPPDARLVACVSRLNALKGVDVLLPAAARLVRRFPDVWFVIAGEGPEKAALQAHARSLGVAGQVLFPGDCTDVDVLLSQSTASVIPSLSEALPNVALESMASGAALVATRVGGTPEVVEDGVTGLLVAPCDTRELERSIARLLGTPELVVRLSRAARTRMAQRYALRRKTRQIEIFYEGLLRGLAPGAIDLDEDRVDPVPDELPRAAIESRRRALLRPARQQVAP
jgi:glycosyltransferase involved in cell wall biosynthesis